MEDNIYTHSLFLLIVLFPKRTKYDRNIRRLANHIRRDSCSFRTARDKNDRLVRISQNQKFVRASEREYRAGNAGIAAAVKGQCLFRHCESSRIYGKVTHHPRIVSLNGISI